jgi:hypothetical protein
MMGAVKPRDKKTAQKWREREREKEREKPE